MTDFGTELTRLMKERNVSVRGFANETGYSKTHISQLCLGQRNPSPVVAEDLDGALHAGGQLAALAPKKPAPRASQERAGIGRSDFLILTGAIIALLDVIKGEIPARIAAISAGQTRMDDETADGLASVVLGYRQVYRSAAPSSLFDPVCGAIRLLIDLAPEAGQHRDKIVSLIGQAGSLAATILMLDQGDFDAAKRYVAIATRAARQSGDDELMGISLAVQAFHACYLGDAPDGLAFAVEAQRVAGGHGVHPLSRGWINAVASEMYATTGDQEGFERALAAAQGFIQEPDPGRPWEGIGAFSSGKLTAYEGGGWLRLGKYEAAQMALHRALGQLDKSCLKHRCTAHIDLADAYARNGQADEAARHGIAALTIVADTRHAESLRRVGLLDADLRPHGTQASRDLHSAYMEARAAT
jgi:transcriptional regulator with XRE-family HTH domain